MYVETILAQARLQCSIFYHPFTATLFFKLYWLKFFCQQKVINSSPCQHLSTKLQKTFFFPSLTLLFLTKVIALLNDLPSFYSLQLYKEKVILAFVQQQMHTEVILLPLRLLTSLISHIL